jgi:hypothetical protein
MPSDAGGMQNIPPNMPFRRFENFLTVVLIALALIMPLLLWKQLL